MPPSTIRESAGLPPNSALLLGSFTQRSASSGSGYRICRSLKIPSTREIRVSISKESAPGSPPLYLKKVDSGGHPSNPRCSSFERLQAWATLKNVRIAGPDIWRRTAGSRRRSSGTGSVSGTFLAALCMRPPPGLVHICSIRCRYERSQGLCAAILKTKAFPRDYLFQSHACGRVGTRLARPGGRGRGFLRTGKPLSKQDLPACQKHHAKQRRCRRCIAGGVSEGLFAFEGLSAQLPFLYLDRAHRCE